MYPLSDQAFQWISEEVYKFARINLTEKKKPLVISRLSKRIRRLGLTGFESYIDMIQKDSSKKEFQYMVDSISTNFTSFFREKHHLDFLNQEVFPNCNGHLKLWSAASSTGQEIYSILIELAEFNKIHSPRIQYKLYASDISKKALWSASQGIYKEDDIKNLSREIRDDYFLRGKGDKKGSVKIKNQWVKQVKFFHMNLMDKQYDLPEMDVIFLRNAIIYFDKLTKRDLIGRIYHYIKPGGFLILGHSESLTGISDQFRLIGKTIYQRR